MEQILFLTKAHVFYLALSSAILANLRAEREKREPSQTVENHLLQRFSYIISYWSRHHTYSRVSQSLNGCSSSLHTVPVIHCLLKDEGAMHAAEFELLIKCTDYGVSHHATCTGIQA